MRWILDNLQLVLVIAGALAAWLSNRKKQAGGKGWDEDDEEAPPATTVTGDDDQTRRIQEEIRRKIAERRGQAAPAPTPADPANEPWHDPAPPVLAPRPAAQELPPVLRDLFARRIEAARQREEAAARVRAQAERDRRRQVEQEEAALREQETAQLRRQVQSRREAEEAAAGAATAARTVWRRQLRDPQTIRQAIVLREVLGPPVGLR